MPKKTKDTVDTKDCSEYFNDITPTASPEANAAFLDKYGYVVICVPWFAGRQNACRMRKELEAEVLRFPEFRIRPRFADVAQYPGDANKYDETLQFQRYGLGGTSFLGAASVFHNRFVRKMREQVMHTLVEHLFRAYVRDVLDDRERQYKLQQFVDRIMIRPQGDAATAESWHRDEAPGMADSDKTFGGWINLDTENQFLSCVPGTHKMHLHSAEPYVRSAKGFGSIAKQHHSHYIEKKEAIAIGPGCILVFMEDLVHEVMSKPLPYTSVRQFFGWRLTKESNVDIRPDNKQQPLTKEDFVQMLREQAVIPLKSGQIPELYPKSYNSLYKNTMGPRWQKFKQENLVADVMPVESERGIFAYMKSLGQLHRERSIDRMHPHYEDHEIELLLPNKHFQLTNPRSGRRETISLHKEGAAAASPLAARASSPSAARASSPSAARASSPLAARALSPSAARASSPSAAWASSPAVHRRPKSPSSDSSVEYIRSIQHPGAVLEKSGSDSSTTKRKRLRHQQAKSRKRNYISISSDSSQGPKKKSKQRKTVPSDSSDSSQGPKKKSKQRKTVPSDSSDSSQGLKKKSKQRRTVPSDSD